jgi:hypothetical protein
MPLDLAERLALGRGTILEPSRCDVAVWWKGDTLLLAGGRASSRSFAARRFCAARWQGRLPPISSSPQDAADRRREVIA